MEKDKDKQELNSIYTDSKQASVDSLKRAAEKVKEEGYDGKISVRDVVLDILGFFIYLAVGFGWMLIMQLIISFVSLGLIHMKIERMLAFSAICSILCGIFYIYKMLKKYR